MPFTKDSRRRHARSTVQSKSLAPPSTLSVLSSSTSGSNSTVTPVRVFHSSLRPSKRYEPPRVEAKALEPTIEADPGHSDKENVNVFSYMDKEEGESESSSEDDEVTEDTPDDDASTTSSAPKMVTSVRHPPDEPRVEAHSMQSGQQQPPQLHSWRKGKVREGSLHSDSGISVRSSSPEQPSPVMRHAYPNVRSLSSLEQGELLSTPGGRHVVGSSPPPPSSSGSAADPQEWSTQTALDRHPEEYYVPSRATTVTQRGQTGKPAAMESRRRQPRPLGRKGAHPSTATRYPNRAGYDVLASVIHSRGDACLKPIYRRFETLNNRILLYLQDEIAEMENELRELDNAVAREDLALGKNYASRRAEFRLPSQLQWRRLDLLGRSYVKVEQYNRALAAYSNLTKSLEPAAHADITAYRAWVAEHGPIVEQEAAFLHAEPDLVAVSARADASGMPVGAGHHAELESSVIIVAFSMVSTIIVFKFVPRLLARLVISAMVGAASLCLLSPAVLNDVQNVKRWRRGITMYGAVMIVLAIVVN